jgi:clan AA aspartic protease (TIGR02281 family)
LNRLGNVFLHAGIWLGLGLLFYVFFLRQEAPPAQVVGSGSIELSRARDGHFHIDGAIQGAPVRFLIDTGASTVSISRQLAARIGLDCDGLQDQAATFSTANGTVQGCISRVAKLEFGPFRISHATVAVLPNLASDALLGMNALREVRMEQAGDKLRLSILD